MLNTYLASTHCLAHCVWVVTTYPLLCNATEIELRIYFWFTEKYLKGSSNEKGKQCKLPVSSLKIILIIIWLEWFYHIESILRNNDNALHITFECNLRLWDLFKCNNKDELNLTWKVPVNKKCPLIPRDEHYSSLSFKPD